MKSDSPGGFDSLSNWYDKLLFIFSGKAIPESQTVLLDSLQTHLSSVSQKRVCVPGAGTGYFVEEISQRFPDWKIDYLDFSPGMISVARKRFTARKLTNVSLIQANVKTPLENGPYDVIFGNYILDLFTEDEVRAILRHWDAALDRSGFVYIADFSIDSDNPVVDRIRRFILKLLYLFFRITSNISGKSLANYDIILRDVGYKRIKVSHSFFGILRTAIYGKFESNQ